MRHMPTDAQWVASRIADLPTQWGLDLVRQWERKKDKHYYEANVALREATKPFLNRPLALDASDASICEAAAHHAERCFSRSQLYRDVASLRAAMERTCAGQGIDPPSPKTSDQAAMARMTCQLWWRRKLRRHHGRAVEAAAICLGRVSKKHDIYVSNEGLKARLQQNARNAAALEATIVRNELNQEFTLAELQAKSTSNKRIKRSELMTRMSGFERYADKAGHLGMFLTLTCPSRFHRFRTVQNGQFVTDNPNYQPEATPAEGQSYLAKVWSRIRAELKRKGLGVYGFRIAEPQHDGTPHWHMLLFCKADAAEQIEAVFRKQALKDSPDEPGAQAHRCDVKHIDKAKGSATGYIAKYIAKNIDGEYIDKDLEGIAGKDAAQRVEAWAARWNIRQFQQIGGPPVGVWRELRRVMYLDADAPECVRKAHAAANKTKGATEDDVFNATWDQYCEAQGGVFCGRNANIKLLMESPERLSRYGEQQAPRAVGIQAPLTEQPEIKLSMKLNNLPNVIIGASIASWSIRSSRHKWEVLKKQKTILKSTSILERGEALDTLDLCQ